MATTVEGFDFFFFFKSNVSVENRRQGKILLLDTYVKDTFANQLAILILDHCNNLLLEDESRCYMVLYLA